MAQSITRRELNKLEVVPYEKARETLRTGDLFFCSGDYPISKAIRHFSKSAWSHVGVVYRDENITRLLFLESELYYGVRMAPLSKYMRDNNGRRKPYKGVIVVASVEGVSDSAKNQCISFGMDELTRPYDNWEIIRIMMRMILRKGKRIKDRKYVCSEFVHACFESADIHFPLIDGIVTPDTIWTNEKVQLKYRIL